LELADAVEGSVIRVGAEAVVKEAYWRGVKLVMKHRLPKRYRSPHIDSRIRRSRTYMKHGPSKPFLRKVSRSRWLSS
jgi:hypothetical protein